MRWKVGGAVLLAGALLVALNVAVPGMLVVPRPAPADPCSGQDAALVVDTGSKRMWVCQQGVAVEAFRVGLGRGGFGKRAQGDNKTPLGEYKLGAPRVSPRFHLFIPVGYPTAEQWQRGFRGGGVGVHGPTSWIRWLPGRATWFNRTRGCIELGSTSEIEKVAQWVRDGKVKRILIQ